MRILLWALLPASVWAAAFATIGHVYGFHSTPGMWAALVGLPGVTVGAWIEEWTRSDTAAYVSMFLGNWILCFGIIKAAASLKRKFSK
jgi:hypothetical protein